MFHRALQLAAARNTQCPPAHAPGMEGAETRRKRVVPSWPWVSILGMRLETVVPGEVGGDGAQLFFLLEERAHAVHPHLSPCLEGGWGLQTGSGASLTPLPQLRRSSGLQAPDCGSPICPPPP